MEIRKIAATAGVAALALGAALPAAALSVGTVTTNSTDVNVGVNADGSLGGSNSAGSSTTGTSATLGASTSVDVQGNATGSMNSGDMSGSAAGSAMIMTRADITADAVGGSTWDSSRTYSDVKSDADLKAYVASQMRSDNNLSAVETTSSDVAVTYKQHGRFLGFIPVTVDATATVDQNGQVTMHYPWYAFLTTTDRADVQAKLQAKVDAMTGGPANASGSSSTAIKLTADQQARLVDGIRRTMSDEFTTSAQANANVNATTGTNQ